jgi:hypothetical protein
MKGPKKMKFRRHRFLLLYLLTVATLFCGMVCLVSSHAHERHMVLKGDGADVYFPEVLSTAAEEVLDFYPETRAAAESVFGWHMDQDVSIVLVGEHSTFEVSAGTPQIVAYAVPQKNLIVVDYRRLQSHPFTLRSVVMHELFHLLLHRYIPGEVLPLWFEEGVCQWASDGIGEIISGSGGVLDSAVIRGDLLPLRLIESSFPRDPAEMSLAYQQSKSIVIYLVETYGRNALVDILTAMKNGKDFDGALRDSLGISAGRFEEEWLGSLKGSAAWMRFIGDYFYGLLFAFAAVLSVAGFIRVIVRKRRAYREYENEEEPQGR